MLGYTSLLGTGSTAELHGTLRNLDIRPEGFAFSTSFDWETDWIDDDGAADFWLYLDREVAVELTPGTLFRSEPLGDTVTDVVVLPILRTDQGPPRFDLDDSGDQAFLLWDPVTAADVVAYEIYWDAGTGTIITNAPIDTVSVVEATPLLVAAPSSGTGTGRVTIAGQWIGETINDTWAIEVTAANQWKSDYGSGVEGDARPIIQGLSAQIEDGLRVTFHDPPASYNVGDRFEFFLGVRSVWISEALDTDDYKFNVKALDAAGNTSNASGTVDIPVVAPLEPLTGASATWNHTTGKITITWADSEDAAATGVKIYSNYETVDGVLGDYILDEAPIASVNMAVETWELTPAVYGTFLFYVRAHDTTGREEDTSQIIRVLAVNEARADLAQPVIVDAEATAGGNVRLTILVDVSETTPAAISIYSGASGAWSALTVDDTEAFSIAGFPITTHVWDSGAPYGSETFFGVRTVDGGGALSPESNIVSVVPDGTAPDTPGIDIHTST